MRGATALCTVLSILLATACGGDGGEAPVADPAPDTAPFPFRTGVEVLAESGFAALDGRRVALVCNAASVDESGTPNWEIIGRAENVELAWLYAPEHGLGADSFGDLGDTVERATGLEVKSLYGRGRAPNPADLRLLDALVYDLADAGVRFFTYTSTLYLCLSACREAGVPLVVLDRPCPLGARVSGPLPDGVSGSFVGKLPVPIRYGLTPGELARWIADELLPGARVEVVGLDGYAPESVFDEQAGGPTWRPPSPNLVRFEGALDYPGVGLFEPANLSVGRGTDRPFERVGAPWLDAEGLALYWEAHCQAAASAVALFTPPAPSDGRYDGEACRGVEITVTDRNTFDPLRLAVYGYAFLAVRHAGTLTVDRTYLRRMVGDDSLGRLIAGEI
ncbi:MAG: DUF1343 domain-containing protein, partial [bacterium]|nr:DUF1343 domain-containing protein [bacterium]